MMVERLEARAEFQSLLPAPLLLTTMSDREGHSGAPPEEDLTLPKATVTKMIQGAHPDRGADVRRVDRRTELLPKDVSCAKETRDLVIECCVGAPAFLVSRISRVDRGFGDQSSFI